MITLQALCFGILGYLLGATPYGLIIEPSPVKGIWEVQIQGRIFYVDDEAKYVLAGANIIETATQKNLTNEPTNW